MLTFIPALRGFLPVHLLHHHPAALEEKQLSSVTASIFKCWSKPPSVNTLLTLSPETPRLPCKHIKSKLYNK